MQEIKLQSIIKKRKEYHKKRKKMSSQGLEFYSFEYMPETRRAPVIDEKFMEIPEVYCYKFGCGKKLNLQEKLAGKTCTNHMIKTQRLFHNGLI